ncbi:MAG: hypothetical protein AN484_22075 [Aphanizomenon flos-aquae WA102]|uniref:Tail fiber protein n=1 Tax=Aphanizomenon flos-aquae WA102 TaxID=1710896 RepID=A0A1B7WUV2_APHFL|nr:MAG: hypothetical protein AN484_22075 [Aphanizomenon flos-aquae WA102]
MPNGTITSTENTFGTVNGALSGTVAGTLTGSVGVPGPVGPAGPGSTWGGIAGTLSAQTDLWTELGTKYLASNPAGYQTAGQVSTALAPYITSATATASFYPLTGNPSSFLTAAALSPYLLSSTAASTYQTLAGMSSYLTTSAAAAGYYPLTGNPSGFLTAASLSGYATESWVTGQGYITSAALTPYLTSATAASTYQTLSGMSSYLTTSTAASTYQTLAGMSDYLAKAGNLAGLASTSAARSNLGLGSLAVVNDAPSDGSQYARKNGAWDVVTATPDFISSVSSPLAVTTGNLTIDLSAYAPLASPALTGNPTAPTPTFGDNDTSIATTAFVQAGLLGGTAVARNLEVEVRNQSGSTIPAGRIVYISGATGNKPLITLAQANNDANSAQTIGFVKTAIANNGTGFVIVRGELENIDTSALTEGVQLYLSPTTAGTWTTTKPSAPQHLVYVGIVIRSHPTLGTILVAVQNGYELGEIHDVALSGLANNDLLAYESSTDLWKNKTYSALGLLTSSAAASTYAPLASPSFTGLATFDNSTNYALTLPSGTAGYYSSASSGVYSIFNASTEVIRLSSGGIKYPDGNTQSVAFPGFTGYAPLASPALTGNVTITSNSTGAALFIEQAGTGNILTLHDQAADTTFVAIDQNGKVNTIPSVTASAGFNVPHGAAPTTPVNGDIWTTTSGLFMRQNGTTQQYVDLAGTQTINGAKTFSNASLTFGNATAASTVNIASGASGSAITKTVNLATGGQSGSTTNVTIGSTDSVTTVQVNGSLNVNSTSNIGTSTGTFILGLANGATTTGQTKTVNIGTAGVAGSTTVIAIGSTTGTSTTTLQGTTNGVTAAADTNSVALATTAYVVGQAGSATPLVDGTAAVGTSLRYARADHVHPTDTTRAALNSPAFTGTPSLPTGTTAVTQTAGNNTTAVATTAFVTAANLGTDDPQLLETCMEGITPALSNTSMTAVAQRANSNIWNLLNYGSAVASGSITHWFSPFDGQWYGVNGWNFSKAGNAVFYANVGLAAGATQNADCRIFWGRRNTDAVGTNIAIKGFQIRFSTAGGTMTTSFGVHNGTSLTEVSMGNATSGGFNKYLVTWDGAGNFTCFRNGVQVATSSLGPTGTVNDSNGVYAGIDYKANTGNTASHTVSYLNSFTMRGAF